MTKLNKNWEKEFEKKWSRELHSELDRLFPKDNIGIEHLRKSTTHRSEAMAFNGSAYTFALKFIKTLMIDTLEEAKMKEKSKKKVRIWHPFSEVIIGDIVFVGGFNSAVKEINQKIEDIKKRYE